MRDGPSCLHNLKCSNCIGAGLKDVVRATAVGRDVVLAGDLKVFRLLCNTNLNMEIPSRGSEEEGIRILLRVWANIQSNRYNK